MLTICLQIVAILGPLSVWSCVRSCGTRAELVVCGRAVMRDARPWLFIFAVLSAVLRSGFRDTLSVGGNLVNGVSSG